MTDLMLSYDFTGTTTFVTVAGSADAHHCRVLYDGLEMARALRATGPIVVDLSGVDRLAAVALLILRRAADDVRRSGRTLTVRHFRQETVYDPLSVRLLESCIADSPGRSAVTAPARRPRHGRQRRRRG